jgi:hypothetical protein
MAVKRAACVTDGVVVLVAEYDEATSGPWLDAVKGDYDSVLIVDTAGIGWEEWQAGSLRPPAPTPDATWDGTGWAIPEPAE